MSESFRMDGDSALSRPEQMLDDILHFSKTLDALRSFDETNEVLCQAVSAVERVVTDLTAWIQERAEGEDRRRAVRRIEGALESICNTLPTAPRARPAEQAALLVRILKIGLELHSCHGDVAFARPTTRSSKQS